MDEPNIQITNANYEVEQDHIHGVFIGRKYKTKTQTKVRAYHQPTKKLSSIKCIRWDSHKLLQPAHKDPFIKDSQYLQWW